jgi:predicted RNase H-like HicB family nuclease
MEPSAKTISETTIRLVLEPLDTGGYVATSPDVQGMAVEGRSITETVEFAQDAIRVIVESYIERGEPLPPALVPKYTGNESIELFIPVCTA